MRSNSTFQCLRGLEIGHGAKQWRRDLTLCRFSKLQLSAAKFFTPLSRAGVTWLDLDNVEHRYLLAGTADAAIGLYDSQATPQGAPSGAELSPVGTVTRNSPGGHRFTVSCVAWYPVDTGLFVTGAYDQQVKVWDTNRLEAVGSFKLPAKVTQVALSLLASTHCLVAAACQEPHIRLCDPASGAFTLTLSGHREAVWSLAWSCRSEFELLSGDACGQLRVWDIRRAGCVHVADQMDTQRPQRRRSSSASSAAAAPAVDQSHVRARAAAAAASAGMSAGSRVAGAAMLVSSQPSDTAPGQDQDGQGSDMHAHGGGPHDAALRRAHTGAITAVVPTPDGLHWLTAGTDSRMRLWDAVHHTHSLVHYADTFNRAIRARQLCVAAGGDVVLHPCGSSVQVFEVASGALLAQLQQGHFESINACVYSPLADEVFTGGNDGQILVWGVPTAGGGEGGDRGARMDRDRWDDIL